MSVTAARSLDTSIIFMSALEIGDMVKQSQELERYLYCKDQLSGDTEAQQQIKQFQQKKEIFAECERFGHFHPDYHQALDDVRAAEEKLAQFESVRQFKQAEEALDELLYELAQTIARSISDTIKVPSNNPLPTDGGDCSSGNCGSGGGCSGNCG